MEYPYPEKLELMVLTQEIPSCAHLVSRQIATSKDGADDLQDLHCANQEKARSKSDAGAARPREEKRDSCNVQPAPILDNSATSTGRRPDEK